MAKRKKKTARKGTSRKPKALNHQQLTFCELYVANGGNATEAARGAQYSERGAARQGSQLLKNALVEAKIAELRAAAAQRAEVEADRVVEEWENVALADIRDVVVVENVEVALESPLSGEPLLGKGGKPLTKVETLVRLKPTDEWPDNAARAVAEVSQSNTGAVKIKMHNKLGALDSLAKYLGILIEKREFSGPGGKPIQLETAPEDLSALSLEELQTLRVLRQKLDAARTGTTGD